MKNMILILIIIANCFASTNPDSLLSILNSPEVELSSNETLDLYYNLGIAYNEELKYEEALKYLSEGLLRSEDNSDKARFHFRIGEVLVDSTSYSLALENLNKSLELYLSEGDISQLFNVYTLIGMCYGLTNDLEEAIRSFNNSLRYSIELKDSGDTAQGYFNLGLANYFLGKYDNATDYYIKSLKIRESLSDTNALVYSLTTLGETLRTREKYSDAMKYYMQALGLKNNISSDETLAYVYSEIGLIYKSEKKYDLALAYMDTSLQISKRAKYKRGVATLYTYMGGIEKELGNQNKALDLYLKSIDAYYDIGFQTGIAQSELAIAGIYFEEGNYEKSSRLLNSAQGKARSNNLLDEQTKIAELLYKIGKATGSPNTLSRLEEYISLKDSLFNIEKEKQINEIETKYETEKKEKQIAVLDQETKLQQQQLQIQKYLIIGGGALTLLVVVVAFMFIRQNKLRSQVMIEQGKMKLLRSQMNPHFIYNALAAIQAFVMKNNPMESASYISGFARLMRIVLESSREDFIQLSEEKEFLDIYMKLQKLRFNDNFDYEIIINDLVDEDAVLIPPMLTQPIVENAIEHGMRNVEGNEGKIELSYKMDESNLVICVADNGPGFNNSKGDNEKTHRSLAREILSERIENIEKLHGIKIEVETYELNPDEENKGTKVIFRIPQRNI